jgi:hypothetical protein
VSTVFVAAGFTLFHESSTPRPKLTDAPRTGATFGLIFRYGICRSPQWNELNTFKETYTKDMVMDPAITTKLKLSETELSGIREEIEHLKLFGGSKAQPEQRMRRTPCSCYYLRVQADSDQNELSWNNCHGEISDKLQEFTHFMIKLIESKSEYQKLPKPRGSYI